MYSASGTKEGERYESGSEVLSPTSSHGSARPASSVASSVVTATTTSQAEQNPPLRQHELDQHFRAHQRNLQLAESDLDDIQIGHSNEGDQELLSPSLPIPSQPDPVLSARAKNSSSLMSPTYVTGGISPNGNAGGLAINNHKEAHRPLLPKRSHRYDHDDDDDDDEYHSSRGTYRNDAEISPFMQYVCLAGIIFTFVGLAIAVYFVFVKGQNDSPPVYRHRSRFGPRLGLDDSSEAEFSALWTPTMTTESFITTVRDTLTEPPTLFVDPKTHEPIYLADTVPLSLISVNEAKAKIKAVTSPDEANQKRYSPALRYVFIEFYANWCGHCRRFAPHVERIGMTFNDEMSSPVRILKIDCAKNSALCQAMNVRAYPTLYWADERKWSQILDYLEKNAYGPPNGKGVSSIKPGAPSIPSELMPTRFDGTHTAEGVLKWTQQTLEEVANSESRGVDGKYTVKSFPFTLVDTEGFTRETTKRAKQAAANAEKGAAKELAELSKLGNPSSVNPHDPNLYLAIAIREALETCSRKLSTRSKTTALSSALAFQAEGEQDINPLTETEDNQLLEQTSCYEALYNWLGWLCEFHVDKQCRPSICALQTNLPKWLRPPTFTPRGSFPPTQKHLANGELVWMGLGSLSPISEVLEKIRRSDQFHNAHASEVRHTFTRVLFERDWKLCNKEWSHWDRGVGWMQCRGSRGNTRGYTCGLWLTIHSMARELADRELFAAKSAAAPAAGEVLYSDEVQLDKSTFSQTKAPAFVHALRSYLYHYFPCEECLKHFLMYSRGLDVAVLGKSDPVLFTSPTYAQQSEPTLPAQVVSQSASSQRTQIELSGELEHPAAQLFMWLWSTHNSVNERLAKVEAAHDAGDPVFPKSLFPSSKICPECRDQQATSDPNERWRVLWKLPEAFEYLTNFYKPK